MFDECPHCGEPIGDDEDEGYCEDCEAFTHEDCWECTADHTQEEPDND